MRLDRDELCGTWSVSGVPSELFVEIADALLGKSIPALEDSIEKHEECNRVSPDGCKVVPGNSCSEDLMFLHRMLSLAHTFVQVSRDKVMS
jgi:hypothetical protein